MSRALLAGNCGRDVKQKSGGRLARLQCEPRDVFVIRTCLPGCVMLAPGSPGPPQTNGFDGVRGSPGTDPIHIFGGAHDVLRALGDSMWVSYHTATP